MNLPIGFTGTPEGLTLPASRHLLLDTTQVSQPAAEALSVLVVDDEEEVRAELAGLLDRRGIPALTANSAEAALGVLRGRRDVGVLVTDIRMPGMDGLALAERALADRPPAEALEILLVTGYVTRSHSLAASRIGAYGLIQKPVRGADIVRVVGEALERAGSRRSAAPPARPDPLPPPVVPRSPAAAAEALLHTLAQRLAGGGAALEATARDLRTPLAALLQAGSGAAGAETARLLALVDDLLDIAALEAGRVQPGIAPISAHGLLGAVCGRLGALGIRCGRRIILQPDADPAFLLDTPRLVRALGHLAARTARGAQGTARADVSIDAGGGQARIDLTIEGAAPAEQAVEEPSPEALLPLSVARRMIAFQGGRLDAWPLPGGGLRARLLLRSA